MEHGHGLLKIQRQLDVAKWGRALAEATEKIDELARRQAEVDEREALVQEREAAVELRERSLRAGAKTKGKAKK